MQIIVFVSGLVLGGLVILVLVRLRGQTAQSLVQELLVQSEARHKEEIEGILSRLKDSFAALSLEALSRSADSFLRLANETLGKQTLAGAQELESKKKLIDQNLAALKQDLEKVQELMQTIEKDRRQTYGEIAQQLKTTAEQTGRLQETTQDLRSALASTRIRGQWGERMAEDILRFAGFVEGINYQKQKSLEDRSGRPDYVFFLPQGLKVNMDVKFPLDNYLHYLAAESPSEQARHKEQFLRDVRNRIKEVTGKDYINPAENTLDYVIVLIPNEQVYAFIQEADTSILDTAVRNKVILCSPLTLYAILAVIRQAVDNFNLEKAAGQILALLGKFAKQWAAFVRSFDSLGRKIEACQEEFRHLTTTRQNQLEKPLREIETLRQQKGIPAEPLTEEPTAALPENAESTRQ